MPFMTRLTRGHLRVARLVLLLVPSAVIVIAQEPRGTPAGGSSAPRIEVLETKVISPDRQNYHGWPTVARLKDGRLLVVCSGGRE